MLLILMGKTCSGKTFITKELEKKYNFQRIITTTSRPIRNNESDGIDYYFITKEKFLKKIKENQFVEYKSYPTPNGEWYYGTSYDSLNNIEDNKNYVIVLTPDGYKELIKKIKIPYKSIYIYSSCSTIKTRLKNRNDTNDSIDRRMNADNRMFKNAESMVDKIIYNNIGEDIDKIIKKIIEIVEE